MTGSLSCRFEMRGERSEGQSSIQMKRPERQELGRVPTPALVIDQKVVQDNIGRLQAYADSHRLEIRPHTKTHKSRTIAEKQLRKGAAGLTFAKPSESAAVSQAGESALLAYSPVDYSRAEQLAVLAIDRQVIATVDSIEPLEWISAASNRLNVDIGLLVEIDVGLGRTGVQSPEKAVELAKVIDGIQGVSFLGIMCYPGHIWDQPDFQDQRLKGVDSILGDTKDQLGRNGLEARIVSGGSTPTAYQSHLVSNLTEIRPGTYVFNDMNTYRGGFCDLSQCGARVICTVVSDARPNQIVVDAGSKTLSMDRCLPDLASGYGYITEFPDAIITYLSEEHGQIDFSAYEIRPRIGDKINIIPNHICPCVNLTNVMWNDKRDGYLYPIQVDARGART